MRQAKNKADKLQVFPHILKAVFGPTCITGTPPECF